MYVHQVALSLANPDCRCDYIHQVALRSKETPAMAWASSDIHLSKEDHPRPPSPFGGTTSIPFGPEKFHLKLTMKVTAPPPFHPSSLGKKVFRDGSCKFDLEFSNIRGNLTALQHWCRTRVVQTKGRSWTQLVQLLKFVRTRFFLRRQICATLIEILDFDTSWLEAMW